ncbi:MAG: 23S rRNA (guanosine(2251)-2'-O)-methyltransferase RlmB [Proteobacteria bacterium]|nr:23S rRNA (guanosine(2251)-2'-O)-methyltransferase RlmB [Pseudomonadota bacterium]
MPYLTNKNSIIELIKNHPETVKRLWIEHGYETVSDEVIKEAKKHGISFKVLPKDTFFKKFIEAKSHICLERDEISYTDPDKFLHDLEYIKNPLLCALDGIYDPQNLGNILRSAACFGVDAIIIPKDRSCGITQTVANISRGGIEHVKIVRVVNLARFIDSLKKTGVFCYGLDEKGTMPIWKTNLQGAACLVLGSEEGLRRLTREKCDEIVKIPTEDNFSSLNVATCFAVSVCEVKRQRATAQIN